MSIHLAKENPSGVEFQANMNYEIFCDNNSPIKIFKNPVLHERSKHINVKFYFPIYLNNAGAIDVVYSRSEDPAADICMKA